MKGYSLPEELDKVNREFFVFASEQGLAYEKITCGGSYRYIRDEMTDRVNAEGWRKSGKYQHLSEFERLQWDGKKVMALMTHEGSGLGHCEKDLKAICKGATFGSGLAVHGADAAKSEQTVARWAKANV